MVRPPGSFNFADVWEMAAEAVPDREALVVGGQRRSYGQLEERANRMANHLAARGVGARDHVALYLENCAEYVETMLAAFKLRAVPINVNYRYVAGELRYLLDNSDSVAVVTQASLRATVDEVLPELPGVRFVLTCGDDYEAALAAAPVARPELARGSDDHYIIYTGGTTGLPKGVVWRHDDAFYACIGGGDPMRLQGPVERPDELPDRMLDQPLCFLPVAPMMHAAAQWTTFSWLFCGGKVVLMPGSLDPPAVWRAVAAEAVQVLTVVGDAVARPLLDAWDVWGTPVPGEPGDAGETSDAAETAGEPAPDIGSLFVLANGGAPLSATTKRRILTTFPRLMLNDGFGSSEAGTQGASRLSAADVAGDDVTGGADAEPPPMVSFSQPAKPTIVVDGDGNEVTPGSGVVGQVLAGGPLPIGYYNDPDRTSQAFVDRGGQRWLITGDLATVGQDGAISLVGRGSGVINSGGEKVFPEEVEGVLMAHPSVYDCLVVGVPDERWGRAVTAVVRPVASSSPTLEELVAHCRAELAGYKAPKHLVLVDRIVRSPSGKADYPWAQRTAEARTGAGTGV